IEDDVIKYVISALRIVRDPADPVALEGFARCVLSPHFLQEVEAAISTQGSGDFLASVRALARRRPAQDPDTKKLWRLVYQVENLRALTRSHRALAPLVDEILSQSVGPYRNPLEERHDELTDPADSPEAVRLAARLARAIASERSMAIAPLGGLEIALRGMLAAAGVRHVPSGADGDVRDARSFAEVWPEFRAFIGEDVLIAHNGQGFDIPVLRRLAAGRDGVDNLVFYDTLPLVRSLSRDSGKLEDLAQRFGIDAGRAHHALDDAVTLARVYRELERRRGIRARKAVLVNLLDYLGLALALAQGATSKERALMDEPSPPPPDRRSPMGRGGTLDESIDRLLERVALSTSDGIEIAPDRVNLLTLHSTKGLEFSRVYIVGVEDYQIPGLREMTEHRQAEIEEARRLLYVGMTRARERLVLTRVERRFGMDAGGSSF